MLFPYLRKYNESLALGYLSLRILEAVAIMVSIISALSLLSTTQYQTNSVHSDMTGYYVVTTSLLAVHDWAYIVGPNFLLGINTLIYSYIFLRSELVPKTLAIVGIVSSILIFIAALLEMSGIIKQFSLEGMLLAFPIFSYEMILAVWLIYKGFNKDSDLLTEMKLPPSSLVQSPSKH
jgi:hypothetical protein